MSDCKQKVRQFIVSNFLFGKDSGLSDDSSFLDTGIIDSTGVMELVAFIEKEFGVVVADRELVPENLDSIISVVSFLTRKSASAPSA